MNCMGEKMGKELAPIVLFVYNRLWHTQQTINALLKNELAIESDLIVYSDGGKDDASWSLVNNVRSYLKTITNFKSVTLFFRDKNIGLATNIIDGVTSVVNKYGKVIVLEDDIVTAPSFLKYMNEALEFYKYTDKVWHVSGWNYPIERVDSISDDVFLWRVMNCWGWATWHDRWRYYKKQPDYLIKNFTDADKYRFNVDDSYDFWSQILDNQSGHINTWAIFWYATIFEHDGLCLNIYNSLVRNIGFDGNATHTKQGGDLIRQRLSKKIEFNFCKDIKESELALKEIKKHMKRGREMEKRFSDSDYLTLSNTDRFTELSVEFLGVEINIPDSASLIFLNKEIFGSEIYKFDSLSEEPVIIDCGANIGISVIYFLMRFPNARIVAFEPDPKIFNYLKNNLESFGFDNVSIINKGLWAENCSISFFSEGADGGRVVDHNETKNSINVEMTTLSQHLDMYDEVDFLKIDIEGAEYVVLQECGDRLSKVKNMFIEYHSFSDRKQTLGEILSIVENNGFRYYIEHTCLKSPHPFIERKQNAGFDNQLNIFCYR